MVLKEKRTDLIKQENNQRITMKPEMIFGVFLGVTFIAITFNQRSNSVCHKKKLFPKPPKYIDVVNDIACIAGVALTTIGKLTVTGSYRGVGKVSASYERNCSLNHPSKCCQADEYALHVSLESCIDDWKVDGDWELSGSWEGFSQFTRLNEKPPNGHTWSGRRLTKIQAPSQARLFLCQNSSQTCQKAIEIRIDGLGAIEKPKLDNVRGLRGIFPRRSR